MTQQHNLKVACGQSKMEAQPARSSQTTPYSKQPGVQNPSSHSWAVLEKENNIEVNLGTSESYNSQLAMVIISFTY